MDIYEIRRVQLQKLIDERFEGKTKRLAEALDMAPPQIHRWRSVTAKDRRRMEWESARGIENKLDLPEGWMDHAAGSGSARRFAEDQMRLATRLVREAEEQAGTHFTFKDFWHLVMAVAEIAAETDRDMNDDDEARFRSMIVKLFASTRNGESHV